MKGRTFWVSILCLLLMAGVSPAAKIITFDPKTGETTVIEKGGEEASESEEVKRASAESEEEIRRLKEIIRQQQEIIRRQQAFISRQREELRRKENIIQGLDMLRRQQR